MDMVTLQETRCSGIKVNNTIKNLGFLQEYDNRGLWICWRYLVDVEHRLIKYHSGFRKINIFSVLMLVMVIIIIRC